MTDAQGTLLDELQWRDIGALQHLDGINRHKGWQPGVNAENIHLYFISSPFCDPISNNKLLSNQSERNASMWPMMFSRKEFEDRLGHMNGLEYRVIEGPERTTPDMNPVWVIRKHNRQKQAGQPDKVTVLGTYFAFAENIYQAPSLEAILRCRLMAATRALNKFYETAASMQFYAPDKGYSYIPPVSKPKAITGLDSTRTSRAGSPVPDTASQTAQTVHHGAKEAQQVNDDRAIAASFSLALQFGSEYMDENPLVGEPGSFKLSQTSRHLKDQHDKSQAEATKLAKENESTRESAAPTPPAPIKTTDLPRKASAIGKAKSPVSAVSDGGVKKRRKSKAPGTPGVASPP